MPTSVFLCINSSLKWGFWVQYSESLFTMKLALSKTRQYFASSLSVKQSFQKFWNADQVLSVWEKLEILRFHVKTSGDNSSVIVNGLEWAFNCR